MTDTETMTTSPRLTPTLTRLLVGLLLASVDVYALGVLGLLAVKALTGERLWQVAMLTNLIPWMLLPSLPLLVALGIARRWQRMALTGVVALLFAVLYGGLFLPSLPIASTCAASDGGCYRLRVMTYNLLGNGSPNPAAQIAVLRESDADVIALQEVSPIMAEAIERELAAEYPYRALYPEGIPGTGLLSRYPILEEQAFKFDSSFLFHLRATLDVNGQSLILVNAHPPPPGFSREMGYHSRATGDIIALLQMVAADPSILLLGDFNATDLSSDYALLRDAGLVDAFRASGWGLGVTFPARFAGWEGFPPLVRIDYVWLTPEFRPVRVWVGPDAGSDHLPLLAEIEWAPGKEN